MQDTNAMDFTTKIRGLASFGYSWPISDKKIKINEDQRNVLLKIYRLEGSILFHNSNIVSSNTTTFILKVYTKKSEESIEFSYFMQSPFYDFVCTDFIRLSVQRYKG